MKKTDDIFHCLVKNKDFHLSTEQKGSYWFKRREVEFEFLLSNITSNMCSYLFVDYF